MENGLEGEELSHCPHEELVQRVKYLLMTLKSIEDAFNPVNNEGGGNNGVYQQLKMLNEDRF